MDDVKDTEAEGREVAATDGRIILVTDDALDSGNEGHQALMQRVRTECRFGKDRTLQCVEGGSFNGRWAKMSGCVERC